MKFLGLLYSQAMPSLGKPMRQLICLKECWPLACSRAGLVEKGLQYFESMITEHGIIPIPDHYTCIIDLLCRAARLEEARNL